MRSKGSLVGEGRTAEIFAWGEAQVLKLFREGFPASLADYEAQVARAVHAAYGVAVPAVGDLLAVDGRRGIIYERIDGPSLLAQIKPWTLFRCARILADLHAAMHIRPVSGIPSQRRQLQAKIREARALPLEARDAVLARLERMPDGEVLCHGDFHPANVILSRRGPIVIDWTDASQGNPLADVARTLLLIEVAGLPDKPPWPDTAGRRLFAGQYLRRYRQRRPVALEEIDAWRIPIAAARLSEGIAEDERRLVNIVKGIEPLKC